MSKKTLKFGKVEINKKAFHASNQSTVLNLVDINQIVTFDRFKNSSKSSKYLINYEDDDSLRPLSIVFPQMSGKKLVEKNMSFVIEDDTVLVKYNDIWNKMKKTLDIKVHSKPVYDEKYVKTKMKIFNGAVNSIFWAKKILKERICYTRISIIYIDFVMRMNKNNYAQVYLEEYRYEIKKKQTIWSTLLMLNYIYMILKILILNNCIKSK